MGYFKIFTLVFAAALFSWQLWGFLSIDEASLRQQASGGAPVKFIQLDEETLDSLKERLESLDALPRAATQDPQAQEFGRRREPFLPDPERSR